MMIECGFYPLVLALFKCADLLRHNDNAFFTDLLFVLLKTLVTVSEKRRHFLHSHELLLGADHPSIMTAANMPSEPLYSLLLQHLCHFFKSYAHKPTWPLNATGAYDASGDAERVLLMLLRCIANLVNDGGLHRLLFPTA